MRQKSHTCLHANISGRRSLTSQNRNADTVKIGTKGIFLDSQPSPIALPTAGRRRRIGVLPALSHQTNKQTNKQTNSTNVALTSRHFVLFSNMRLGGHSFLNSAFDPGGGKPPYAYFSGFTVTSKMKP